MICPKCGKPLEDGWMCCPYCGTQSDDVIVPEEQLKMFTKEWSNGRKEYRYGPEWVAQMLLMEGGYPTPEEARRAWEEQR